MKYLNKFFFYIIFIFFILFFILQSAFDKGIEINQKYPVLDDAIMNVMYKTTISHLFLEEILSGDEGENIQEIEVLFSEAKHYSKVLLQKQYLDVFKKDEFKTFKILEHILKDVETLQSLALKRYKISSAAAAGTDADIEYDTLFEHILQESSTVEDYIHHAKEDALQKFILLKNTLDFFFLITVLISLYYVYRANKKYVLKQNHLIKTQSELHKSLDLLGENVITSTADLQGIITDASNALCKISGYSKEELLGKPHSIFRHPDMDSKVYKGLWETIQQQKTWSGEIKNLHKNGEFYWVQEFITPLYDENNRHIGYSSIKHDITSSKAKDQFMANMSHELRTPLNSIIGFSGILNKKQTNSSHRELSQQIFTSARSLLSLINDILDLSKIQDSKFKIEPYEFCAYNELVDFSYSFEGLTAKKTLHFKTSFDDSLQAVFYGDWTRMSQIILNIVSNAVKFTPLNGNINVSCTYIDGKFVVSIEDNGIGMSRDVQNKIFEPFEQADGSTTRKYGGTGLGLSITQELVQMMNGSIELESQENVGTKFTITLPLEKLRDKKEATLLEEESDSKEGTLQGHVLIVEDNKTNQMLIGMLLDDFGVSSDIANDGIEATNIFDPKKHQLVLMDENMPNMNGLEAMKIIREKFPDEKITIVALTANAMSEDKERFLKAGMDDYLSKPIDEELLYKVLKHSLDF